METGSHGAHRGAECDSGSVSVCPSPDSRPSLGAIHCPTLVLVGNEDALTLSAARMIAEGIVGSKLDIVQDCGHLSTMERPDAVTEALRAWIAR
jgi:pimeloyl-ACP methyl ester carboxylesterase